MLTIAGTLLVGPWIVGCKSIASLRQRCITGDTASCEAACKKGVPGEGGCFHAGNQLREKASLDFGGAEFRRASDYFVRSCDGGYGDGCFLAAEMVEAPYAPDPASWGAALPKMISDAEVKNREKRLDRACALGSARGCTRLGDVLVGKHADGALAAYRTACDAGAAPADCRQAREAEVAQADKWRAACTLQSADDCARLGDLLYQVDPPRGLRLFVSECQLRGVADFVGGVVAFLRERAAHGPPTAVAPVADEPSKFTFDVLRPLVKGPVAVAEVLRAFTAASPELSACVALEPGAVTKSIPLELLVDATGDVFRARATGGTVAAPVARCVERILEGASVSKPPGPALVTLDLGVRAADARSDSR
jgi:hypothetical protein